MHRWVLLRVAGWSIGTALVVLIYYPIFYKGGWDISDPITLAVRLLVPALLAGALSLVYYKFSNDDTPQAR